MRNLVLLPLLIFGLVSCSDGDAVDRGATVEQDQPLEVPQPAIDPAEAIAAIMAEAEVIDVLFDKAAAIPWTVGVVDNGQRRTGYAEYLCIIIAENGAQETNTSVRVVDYAAFMADGGNARDASLGHVDCNTGRDLGV